MFTYSFPQSKAIFYDWFYYWVLLNNPLANDISTLSDCRTQLLIVLSTTCSPSTWEVKVKSLLITYNKKVLHQLWNLNWSWHPAFYLGKATSLIKEKVTYKEYDWTWYFVCSYLAGSYPKTTSVFSSRSCSMITQERNKLFPYCGSKLRYFCQTAICWNWLPY